MSLRLAACIILPAFIAGAGFDAPAPAPLAAAQAAQHPWMDAQRTADERAAMLVAAMTLEEKLSLVRTHFPPKMADRPADVPLSAGYHPGIPRLGIPAQRLSDASLGVAANQRQPDPITALPSGLAIAAGWDVDLARAGGALAGREARRMGFNILLGGGVNLVRDPRGGRSFEYVGEDALLAGVIAGNAIAGTQSEQVLSTVKHYILNAQETGRSVVDARTPLAQLRESDLFAFQKAIEIGAPGSVMCSYNKVRGNWPCQNRELLDVLKRDLRYPGYVMSDWGGVHSTVASVDAGMDQESGWEIAPITYYGAPLVRALKDGKVTPARLDDMVRRILRSMFAVGLFDRPIERGPVDVATGAATARKIAANGITLLRNERAILPLTGSVRSIAVIGQQADFGVLSGGGSSQVLPTGSRRIDPPAAAPQWGRGMIYHPSSPLAAIQRRAPGAKVSFANGKNPAAAARLAAQADVTIVFAHLWSSEAMDAGIALPDGQDAMIAAVARANPRTIVVLENNAAVLMPWINAVPGVVAAWFSGSSGGEAIADMLFGHVDAAGRLPITFPRSLDQLPMPALPGAARRQAEIELPEADQPSFPANYVEGADTGYRWFAKKGYAPLFPFGYGLSYTRFVYSGLSATPTGVRFAVANVGGRDGTDTPQVYVAGQGQVPRLAGWARVLLAKGARRAIEVTFDPRRFARFDDASRSWVVAPGKYEVTIARHAGDRSLVGTVTLVQRSYAVDWKPATEPRNALR